MRDGITVDILKIDENDFKGTISPIEAKNQLENEVYNGKRKIFQSHEEDWLTKELVEKTLRELKPKCCSFGLFKDGASELCEVITKLMFKFLKKKKPENNGKLQEYCLFLKEATKKKQKTNVQ